MQPQAQPLGRLTGANAGAGGRSAYLRSSSPVASVPAAPKGHGALDYIPALTSTLGAIGGGTLGTAVAPGVGTVGGGVVGAGAGQAIGKAIENAITGDKTTVGDEAKQAAFGAGGQLAGGLAGKLFGKLAGGAASKLSESGTKALARATFGGATKTAQITNKAGSTMVDLSKYGLTPDKFSEVIPQVTGESGIGTTAVRTALTGAKPVNLTDTFPLAAREADNLDVLKPGSGRALRDSFNNAANQHLDAGVPITKFGANNAFDLMKTFETKAFSKGVDPATKQAYLNIAHGINDKLTAAGADNAVLKGEVIHPNDLARLATISPKLADAFGGAKTVGELRSIQAPFVRAQRLLDDAATQGEHVSGGAGTGTNLATAGLIGAAPLTGGLSLGYPAYRAIKAAVASSGGQKVVGNVLNTIGGNSARAVVKEPGIVKQTVGALGGAGSMLGRLAGAGLGQIGGAASTLADAPTAPAPVTDTTSAANPDSASPGPNQDQINQMLEDALSAPDAKTQGAKLDLISKLLDVQKKASPTAAKSTATEQARSEAGNIAKDAINQLETNDPKTGFVAAPFEELKSKFSAGDPNTIAFDRTISNLKASLAKARAGSAFTPNEEKLLDQYVPKVGDSRQQLETKLAYLNQVLNQPQ